MSNKKAQHWQEKLAESRAALRRVLDALEPAQWEAPVFGEGETWTVKTVIGHLIDTERGMSIHVHKIRKGEETLPENFDLDRWNAGIHERMGERSAEELLAGLAATREKTLSVLASIEPAQWALTGRHPSRGVITIEQYYETIALHEQMHGADIEQTLADA